MDAEELLKAEVAEALRLIEEADVIVIAFSHFDERLLIDVRSNALDGPYIRVVQPLGSAEERLRELHRVRPSFPDTDKLAFFAWPRSINGLKDLGIWALLHQRVTAGNAPEAEGQLGTAFNELKRLEEAETLEAIGGTTRYRSLWERKR